MIIADIIEGFPIAPYKKSLLRNLLPKELQAKDAVLNLDAETQMVTMMVDGETIMQKTFDEVNSYGQVSQGA